MKRLKLLYFRLFESPWWVVRQNAKKLKPGYWKERWGREFYENMFEYNEYYPTFVTGCGSDGMYVVESHYAGEVEGVSLFNGLPKAESIWSCDPKIIEPRHAVLMALLRRKYPDIWEELDAASTSIVFKQEGGAFRTPSGPEILEEVKNYVNL